MDAASMLGLTLLSLCVAIALLSYLSTLFSKDTSVLTDLHIRSISIKEVFLDDDPIKKFEVFCIVSSQKVREKTVPIYPWKFDNVFPTLDSATLAANIAIVGAPVYRSKLLFWHCYAVSSISFNGQRQIYRRLFLISLLLICLFLVYFLL